MIANETRGCFILGRDRLIAVEGAATVTVDGQALILNQGMSTTITEKVRVSVENEGGEPVFLIQVLS